MAEQPRVHLTLSEDSRPAVPTILVTVGAEVVHVNVLGVQEDQGANIAQLLIEIGTGLARALNQQDSDDEARHEVAVGAVDRVMEREAKTRGPRFNPKPMS